MSTPPQRPDGTKTLSFGMSGTHYLKRKAAVMTAQVAVKTLMLIQESGWDKAQLFPATYAGWIATPENAIEL